MRHFPFLRTLGIALAAGSVLVLGVVAWAQAPPPQAPPAADAVRQLRDELAARTAKAQELQAQQVRLKAELEVLMLEIRAVEERLKQAIALHYRQAGSAAEAERPVEQRLQQIEQKLQLLLKEVQSLRQASPAATKFSPVDFQDLANHKRKETFHSGNYAGNTLEGLGPGERKLRDVPFRIGEGVLQLGSTELSDKPAKITGIKVGKKAANLHFLHATAYYLEEEVPIGSYTVHYADGTTETVPIVNGKDVADWWKYPFSKPPTRSQVAWEGANPGAKELDATLWLFLSTWKNPKPDVAVASIDYASTMDTRCAPFCVAVTAEGP